MPKTIACILVKSPKLFSWLGHLPILNWSVSQLTEVRGIDRIICVTSLALVARAKTLLKKEDIEVVALPKALTDAKDAVIEQWLTAANGPASDADTIVFTKATAPFLPAAKVEACLNAVNRGKCTSCQPARAVDVVVSRRKTKAQETVESIRVFRVSVPAEQSSVGTVIVSTIESLDVDQPDQFVMADALVSADKI